MLKKKTKYKCEKIQKQIQKVNRLFKICTKQFKNRSISIAPKRSSGKKKFH